MEHDIFVNRDGTLQFIYDDDLADGFAGEEQETRRASHVEPFKAPFDWRPATRWQADMAPVGGPVLGPFDSRQQALDAEREWLRKRMSEAPLRSSQ